MHLTFTIKLLVYSPSPISVCKRDNVQFIHEEHFAEHHKVLNGKAKDTMNVINKQEKRGKNNTQIGNRKKSVLCVLLCGRLHALRQSCVCVVTIVPVPL